MNYVVSSWVFVNKKTTHAYSSPPYAKKGQILKEVWPHVFIIKGISTHVEKPKFHWNPWREDGILSSIILHLDFLFSSNFFVNHIIRQAGVNFSYGIKLYISISCIIFCFVVLYENFLRIWFQNSWHQFWVPQARLLFSKNKRNRIQNLWTKQ